MYDFLGFILVAMAALIISGWMANRRSAIFPASLLIGGVALRIVGSTARYEVLHRFYRGVGDAPGYYRDGLARAQQLWSLDLTPLSFDSWFTGSWWGTPFLENTSGLVVTAIGPSMRGEFLAFSIVSFAGLYAIARAVRLYHPGAEGIRFARWLWLWPTLWFWPSSVGKEAIMMFGIGLFVYGYASTQRTSRLIFLLAGAALVFAIRPHVAATLAFSMAIAHWIGSWQKFTLRQGVELVVAIAIAVVAFNGMVAQFGIGEADLEGMMEFAQERAGQTLQGGSSLGTAPALGGRLPMAYVNVWFRPFPFEAHNLTALIASFEIMLFWYLVWRERSSLLYALKHWREHRLLRFAVPFVLGYTLMIGVTFGNMGIIARQRTPLFPFAFMILLAASEIVKSRRRTEADSTEGRRDRVVQAAARVKP